MRNLIRVGSVVMVAMLGLVLLLPSGASAKKKRMVPHHTYKAMLQVKGSFTQTSVFDERIECVAGRYWKMEERSEIDVRSNILIQTYKNLDLRATTAYKANGAKLVDRLVSYEEQQDCWGFPVELEKPKCGTVSGKGMAQLRMNGRWSGKGTPEVMIKIGRRSGGHGSECFWTGPNYPTPKFAEISTWASPGSDSTLPLGLKIGKIRSLGVKKSLKRTIRIGNTCVRPIVYQGKPRKRVVPVKDGECGIEGTFKVTIKRLNFKTNKNVPAT